MIYIISELWFILSVIIWGCLKLGIHIHIFYIAIRLWLLPYLGIEQNHRTIEVGPTSVCFSLVIFRAYPSVGVSCLGGNNFEYIRGMGVDWRVGGGCKLYELIWKWGTSFLGGLESERGVSNASRLENKGQVTGGTGKFASCQHW
jgi:hypothetical protein